MSEKIPIRPATIVVKDGKILLVKSKYEKEFYLLPGGGIEFGETIEEAAVRETLEETGMKVEIIKPIYVNEYIDKKDKSKRVVNIFFLARLKGRNNAKVQDDSGKIKRVEWIRLEEVNQINLKPEFLRHRIKSDFENGFCGPIIYSVDYKNG